MKLKFLLVTLIATMLLMGSSACGSTTKSERMQLTVDSSYKGKNIEIAKGDSLMVTLEHFQTSAGEFCWLITDKGDQTILKMIDGEYVTVTLEEITNGATETGLPKEVLIFKALKKGTSTIYMGSIPSVWSIPPTITYPLTVTVK